MKNKFTPIMLTVLCAVVPLSAAQNFSGSWDTNWGRIEMTQKGSKVMGHYTGQFSGIIDGTVSGSRLSFTWTQPNGQYGKGYFEISPDGSTISGTWGIEESNSNGGNWSGTRAGGTGGW